MQRGDFTEKELFNEEAMLEALSGDRPAVKAYLTAKTKEAAIHLEGLRCAIDQEAFSKIVKAAFDMYGLARKLSSEALMRETIAMLVEAIRFDIDKVKACEGKIKKLIARFNSRLLARGLLDA